MQLWCVGDPSYVQDYVLNEGGRAGGATLQGHSETRRKTLFVDVSGPLSKWGGTYLREIKGKLYEIPYGTSYVQLERTFRRAALDDQIGSVIVRFDSGGGTSTGLSAAVTAYERLSALKPTISVIDDWCCSAAYWLACVGRHVVASGSSISGSIGSYVALLDTSELARRVGISVKLVRSGRYKAVGLPGTEISDEDLASYEMLVRENADDFLRTVVRHRKLAPKIAAQVAEAAIFPAQVAKVLGLIDEIAELEDVLERQGVDDLTLALLNEEAARVAAEAKTGSKAERDHLPRHRQFNAFS